MISHNEAQALISARQDQMLDPIAEHELSAHLATCDSCRAFARSTDSLTQGLRTLPYMPASPAVRRAVLERVEQGRSPFARFAGMFESSPGPALSTLAIIALVLVLGFFALNRFVLQDGGNGDNGQRQLASQPTAQAPATETPSLAFTTNPTETPANLAADETPAPTDEPTETPAPTRAAATEAPTETAAATETPAPTATSEATLEPTATETPAGGMGAAGEPTEEPADLTLASASETVEPTATTAPTAEPTATATLEPTATNEPTPEPTATNEPTPEPTATNEPTPEPTATTAPTPEPTATTAPTPEPTATAQPTPKPKATEKPTEEGPPPIVPIDGSQPIDTQAGEPTPDNIAGRATDEQTAPDSTKASQEIPTIEPIDGETVKGTESTVSQIEPVGPAETPATDETPETTPEDVVQAETVEDLEGASELYSDIEGDPGGRLILTNDGRMVFGDQPHAPTMVTPAGRTLETVDADGGSAVALCDDAEVCTDVSSGSREGSATDMPLGIIGAEVIYVRETGDTVEYRRSAVEGQDVIADEVLYSGDSQSAPQGAVYYEDDRLWIPTVAGDWVMLSDSEGTLLPGGYANPQLVRFAGTDQGLMLGFVAEGQLVITEAESPATSIMTLPFSGADFDISPAGDQVVVSTGSSIDIYDMSGALVVSYSSPDIRPGTVLWLNSGIVYVNTASGALYQIPETAS